MTGFVTVGAVSSDPQKYTKVKIKRNKNLRNAKGKVAFEKLRKVVS